MATTPVAAELPVAVLYADTEVAALAAPDRVAKVADQARAEPPRQAPERVADAEIHQP
jgi:hypothetical protein